MPIYYFEIETKQTGWLRMDADTTEEAMNDVKKNGFNAADIIESNVELKVVSIEGGEEGD
jgi:hypothetical protein